MRRPGLRLLRQMVHILVSERVYRAATARHAVWHWPGDHAYTGGPRSACLSWPLDPTTAKSPVSVDIADRCRGNGCRHRWDAWLRATVRACLAADATPQPVEEPA